MSLIRLKAELSSLSGANLMPQHWPIEALITWCREIAKHNADALEPNEDGALFEAISSFIERLLVEQDVNLHSFYQEHRTSLFDEMAGELDDIVQKELVSRIVGFHIHHQEIGDLFRRHIPIDLGH